MHIEKQDESYYYWSMIMSLEIHINVKAIQQNRLSKSESNKSAFISTNCSSLSKAVVTMPLEPVTASINNLALATLSITYRKFTTTSTSKLSFAAGWLVGKEDLAPYFKCSEKDQSNAFLAAVAFITVWMITKSGKDTTNSQFLLDLRKTHVLGLNVEQLLEIRQTALLDKSATGN